MAPQRSGKWLLVAFMFASGLLLIIFTGGAYLAYQFLVVNRPAAETVRAADEIPQVPAKPDNSIPPVPSQDTDLARVKAAIVTVQASLEDEQSTGAGFLIPGPGLVVTSARTIGQSRKPKAVSRVQVIIGTDAAARTLFATILGADPELDLALLQVTSFSLPNPVSFGNPAAVKRTHPVFAFAGPAAGGDKRGVSVLRGTVTGVRGITGPNPWFLTDGIPNWATGGPITDESGHVIGVVKLVPSTQEIAALPADTIQAFVNNTVKSAESSGPLALATPSPAAGSPRAQPPAPDVPGPVDPPRPPPIPKMGLPFQPGFPQMVDPRAPEPKPVGPPKPPITFPAVASAGIKPAPLAADSVELKLPGKVTDSCVGGGGRYWFLYLPDARQIAVFDVNAAKVVKYIPAAAESLRFTAGMNKLIIAYPDQGIISRYDIATFEKEVTVKVPFDGIVRSVAMGHSSGGPLLVQYAKGGNPNAFEQRTIALLDLTKFQELDLGPGGVQMGGMVFQNANADFRPGPDGKIIAQWPGAMGNGVTVYTLSEAGVKVTNSFELFGPVNPAADGTLICSNGLFTSDLRPIGKKDNIPSLRVPALHGPLYLVLGAVGQPNFRNPHEPVSTKVSVFMLGDNRHLATLPDLKLVTPVVVGAQNNPTLQTDKRVLFCPDGKLVGVLSPTEDKLVLLRFDLEAELQKSGIDYLYVASRPPAAPPGKTFKYPVEVKSKKGGVKLKLESGPPGMKLDGNTILWDVPKDWAGPESILLTVSDASGQEVFHTFTLSLPPAGAAAQPAAIDIPPPGPPPPRPLPAEGPDPGPRPQRAASPVRSPESTFPITPTKAADKAELKLPGPADAVCMAGGGRFVLFRIPMQRQIAVLDVSEGKMVKTLPLSEDGALVTGGMNHLYALSPTANVIQRWSLKTFEKEVTVPNPLNGVPRAIVMGHASDGPLLVVGPNKFLDTKTFQEANVGADLNHHGLGALNWQPQSQASVRVSADGRVYAWSSTATSPSGLSCLVLGEPGAKPRYTHTSVGAILPGPDGTLFTSAGLFTPDLKKKGPPTNAVAIPAAQGMFYLSVTIPTTAKLPGKEPTPVGVTLLMLGEARPLAELGNLEGLDPPTGPTAPFPRPGTVPKLSLTDRVYLIPEAKALVILNGAAENVIIHKVDVDELLKKSDINFLFVMSKPPAAERGATFAYTPVVKSKKGGCKLKLDAGPDGMKVVDDKIVWEVPKRFAADDVSVIVTVSDAGGQEIFHSFNLVVKDR